MPDNLVLQPHKRSECPEELGCWIYINLSQWSMDDGKEQHAGIPAQQCTVL